jgi:hypothetical protein
VLWIRIRIRIRIDPHHFGKLVPHPDPHQIDLLDPDPHKVSDDKPQSMEYEPICALFQEFEPLFGS